LRIEKATENVMPFVNEDISEADQQRINFSALRAPGPFSHRQPLFPSNSIWWTVDRERDAYFIRLGGGIRREETVVPHTFLFSWRGERMRVEAWKHEDYMLKLLTWEVVGIHPLGNSPVSNDDVMPILAQAFVAFGEWGGGTWPHARLKEVRVDFSNIKGA
jgi:hypothetical protein